MTPQVAWPSPPLEGIRPGIAAAAGNAARLPPDHIDPASVIRRRVGTVARSAQRKFVCLETGLKPDLSLTPSDPCGMLSVD